MLKFEITLASLGVSFTYYVLLIQVGPTSRLQKDKVLKSGDTTCIHSGSLCIFWPSPCRSLTMAFQRKPLLVWYCGSPLASITPTAIVVSRSSGSKLIVR